MSEFISIEQSGIKQIDELLRGLPQQMTNKLLVASGKEALKPIIKSAKAKVPINKGGIKKSIGTKKLSRNKDLRAVVFAGPRIGGRHKGYLAHMVEGGTKGHTAKSAKLIRFKTKSGEIVFTKRVKGTPARPFMEPAIKENLQAAKENYREAMATAITRYMKRIIKNTGGNFAN